MSGTRVPSAVWPELVGAVLCTSRYASQLKAEVDDCLMPIPWNAGDRLPVPYGAAELPYLKRTLYSPDDVLVGKSLQALVEHAHDRFRAMDMLKQDVLSPLNRLTRHAEPFVRQRCCALIGVLAGQPTGKVSVVRNAALVRSLMALAGDAAYGVRLCGAAAVAALAERRTGNETMVSLGCADRALYRAYVERDDRVVLALLCTVGRLMDDNRTGRERTERAAAALGRFLDGRPGRALIGHLTRGVRSSDYRTAVDAAACLARAAAAPEVRARLARDRGTVDLLATAAVSSERRARALRALSVRLLCSLVAAPGGPDNVRTAAAAAIDRRAAAVRWSDDDDNDDDDDHATRRRLRKLVAAAAEILCAARNTNENDC